MCGLFTRRRLGAPPRVSAPRVVSHLDGSSVGTAVQISAVSSELLMISRTESRCPFHSVLPGTAVLPKTIVTVLPWLAWRGSIPPEYSSKSLDGLWSPLPAAIGTALTQAFTALLWAACSRSIGDMSLYCNAFWIVRAQQLNCFASRFVLQS